MEFNESTLFERDFELKLITEDKRRQLVTLHCDQCKTVLGDSLGVCGEVKCLDSIMCTSKFTVSLNHNYY